MEREKLTEWFAEDYSLNEIKEMFTATFGRRISIRELHQFRMTNTEEIERLREEEYQLAKTALSPAGLLRYIRRMVKEAQTKGSNRLVETVQLLRLAKEVWELDHKIEVEKLTEEEKLKAFLEEMLRENERNREIVELAEQAGLLRFQQLQIGGD